jgi:hypothetical protein
LGGGRIGRLYGLGGFSGFYPNNFYQILERNQIMTPKFIKEIAGIFKVNLANIFLAKKDKIVMLKKGEKYDIKDPNTFSARPMVKDGQGFGFESVVFTNSPEINSLFKNQEYAYLQFMGEASAWITGAQIIDKTVQAHTKLDRAQRIEIKNPKLYSVKKTSKDVQTWHDEDGKKRQKTTKNTYTEYFLQVDSLEQVEPYKDPYRDHNLVEIARLIAQE